MGAKLDYQDITLTHCINGYWNVSLVQAVASGNLYIKNKKGEFEQVQLATYWRNHENGYFGICTISTEGTEYDEDGNTTRDFRLQRPEEERD